MIRFVVILCACTFFYVRSEDKMEQPDCAKTFECYSVAPCNSRTDKIMINVLGGVSITTSCDAIVKIHPYNDYKAFIVLESFNATVTSLILSPRIEDPVTISYTCEVDPTTNVYKVVEHKSNGKIAIKMEEPLTTSDKTLKCSFIATSKVLPVLGKPGKRTHLEVKKGTAVAVNYEAPTTLETRCDPSLLVFQREKENEDKVYRKFIYNLGELSCNDDKVFHAEFLSPSAENFEPITSFECKASDIMINGNKQKSEVIARCAADASYGCDYDVRYAQGKEKLKFDRPDLTTAKKGSLKCPASHKFLVVGNNKPKENTITCKNHGRGVMKWTTADGKWLTESGPEVYCTDKLSCKPMSLLAVTSGFLKQSFPSCYEDGKMSITDGNESFDDLNFQFKCDTSDGLNKFTAGNTTRIITDATKFTCSYPDKASAKTAKNKAKVIGAAIAGIIAFSIVAPLVVWLIVIVNYRRNVRKHKELAKAEETKEYNKFIAEDDDQKKTITSLAPSSKKVVAFSPATERKFAEMTKFLYVDIEDQMEPLPDIPVKEFNDVRDVEDVLTKRLINDKILSLEPDVEESIRYLAEDCKKIEKEKKENYKKKKEAARLQQQAKS